MRMTIESAFPMHFPSFKRPGPCRFEFGPYTNRRLQDRVRVLEGPNTSNDP